MSQVRFQADWNLNHIIVQAAQRRKPTLDFQTAHAASLLGVSDWDVLRRATREGRLLATHDFHDMPQHFAAFIQEQTSAGVLLVPEDAAQLKPFRVNRLASLGRELCFGVGEVAHKRVRLESKA